MIKKEFTFSGYMSGDYECFCFAVPESDAKAIIPWKLDRSNMSRFHPGLYAVYPHHMLHDLDANKQAYQFKITIEATPIDKEALPKPSAKAMRWFNEMFGRFLKSEAEPQPASVMNGGSL